jgi:hypothetical protein
MFLKTLIVKMRGLLLGVVALALSLTGATAVFAQGETPPEPGVRWGGGVVTSVGAGSFTVHGRAGRDQTLLVDANTLYFTAAGRPAAFTDLTVGARVAGSAEFQADGQRHALLIISLPPRTRYVGGGLVTALEADAFHFVNRRGQVWEFYVDASTAFTDRTGQALTFADLAIETRAFVRAELREDGLWWALVVKVGR